jgi:hypothetical protein
MTDDRYARKHFAAPSPDGNVLAFAARGIASAHWWRKGHSRIDESEIWLAHNNRKYERVTQPGAKSLWPMWSAEGQRLFYMSDRSGVENIWERPGRQISGGNSAMSTCPTCRVTRLTGSTSTSLRRTRTVPA